MEIRTKRWTRSPRGCVLGVATGLAEWRGLPVKLTRLLVFLICITTAFFPALIIYLLIALILPEQTCDDIIKDNYHSCRDSYYDPDKRREDEELKKRYENLKRKVEGMENDLFDKEKEWDAHFKAETAV